MSNLTHEEAISLVFGIKDLACGAQEYFCEYENVEGKACVGSYQLICHAASSLLDYLNKIDMEGLPARK